MNENRKNKGKVLQLANVASMIFMFNKNNIDILQNMGYNVEIAANFNDRSCVPKQYVDSYSMQLHEDRIQSYDINIPRKIYKISSLVESYKQIKNLANKNNYKFVHCHSPIGGVLARLAFSKARKRGTRVIYTAHGFHFYKGAPLINWLIFYPIEWLMSFKTDVLITINQEDFKRAKKHMHAKRIEYIHGIGIDMRSLKKIVEPSKLRQELGIKNNSKVLISVGELSNRKNHQAVIKAIHKIINIDKTQKSFDDLTYIVIGEGCERDNLLDLATRLNLSNNVKLLGYRNDVENVLQIADLYVHPSVREGLGVAVMEAINAHVPVICSDRGCRDLVEKCQLFDPDNIDEIYAKILDFLNCDQNKLKTFCNKNYENLKNFSTDAINRKMFSIYKDI